MSARFFSRRVRFSPCLPLALALPWAGALSAQEVTPETAVVTERDDAPAEARFRYHEPPMLPDRWFEFAVIPRGLRPGVDFAPFRETRAAAGGAALDGTITLPVLPDTRPEETGALSLVVRGPNAVDWAAAFSSPVTVSEFTSESAAYRILHWSDDMAVAVRSWTNGGNPVVATYSRSHQGAWVETHTLATSGAHLLSAKSNGRVIVIPGPAGVETWVRGTGPQSWQRIEGSLPGVNPAAAHLFADRLLVEWPQENITYRRDSLAPGGWRKTGKLPKEPVFHVGEDFIVLGGEIIPSTPSLWERAPGSEDHWHRTYTGLPETFSRVAASAPGLLAVFSSMRLEIHERQGDGAWAKTGTINQGPSASSVAVAGDWVAVGYAPSPPAQSMVRLHMRSAADRSVWESGGTLKGPGYEALRWNGPELISNPIPAGGNAHVVRRTLTGGTVTVRDNDRPGPKILTSTLREPLSAPETAYVTVELPMPAEEDRSWRYEILPGTAEDGADLTAAAGEVTIPAGAVRARIPVTLLPDNVLEETETFTVRLLPDGAAPVTGTVEILESGPPAVLSAEATVLVEGYGNSTVTLRQYPAAGGALPPEAAKIGVSVGGFEEPPELTGLATAGLDLDDQALTPTLSPASPEASFTVTAKQDDLREYSSRSGSDPRDEWVRMEFTGLGGVREPGSLGVAFDGVFLPPETGAESHFSGWAFGGDWLCAAWSSYDSVTLTSSGEVACHRVPRGGGGTIAAAVQRLPWGPWTGAPKMETDGQILILGGVVTLPDNGFLDILQVYERTDSPEIPWRLAEELRKPTLSRWGIEPRILGPRLLLWGDRVLEKTGTSPDWRLAALTETSETILSADGEWMLTRAYIDGKTEFRARRRTDPHSPEWAVVKKFFKGHDGVADLERGGVRGRTLIIEDRNMGFEFYRLSPGGEWELEQHTTIPHGYRSPETFLAGESTLVLDGLVCSRTGPPGAPWIVTQRLDDGIFAFRKAGGGGEPTLSGVSVADAARPRLSVLRAGALLSVYDDDSLQFTWSREENGVSARVAEDPFQEVSTQVTFYTHSGGNGNYQRTPPFPMTVRVRSGDEGSATAGLDYAPVDVELPVIPQADLLRDGNRFPIRIFSDRIPEDLETFVLRMDPPVVGRAAPPTRVVIGEKTTKARPSPDTVTLYEPARGAATQFVEFSLEAPRDGDMRFQISSYTPPPAAAAATRDRDFKLATTSILLKAGESRLRVPVTVLADTLEEPTEEFMLSARGFLTVTPTVEVAVSIVDAALGPRFTADAYTGIQGAALTADGVNGNPPGAGANDAAPTEGIRSVADQPPWGTVTMAADGTFTAVPGPNVIGPVSFRTTVDSAPYFRFLDYTAVWKYLHPVTTGDPGRTNPAFHTTWHSAGFDDSAWASGAGTISYGGFPVPASAGPGTVALREPSSNSRYTDYFRATFECPAEMTVPLRLKLYCDDGAIIYLNGVERGRAVSGTAPAAWATAADTYRLLAANTTQSEEQEVTLQTADLGAVPLRAGTNLLAISLHNRDPESSDLGLRLMSLETTGARPGVPAVIDFADAHVPPVGTADTLICPQNAVFRSGDNYGAGLLDNDGLFAASGEPYDPILEITASEVSAGTLTLTGLSGNFTYTPPPDFVGEVTFTYQLRDKDGVSAPVPVTLTVTPRLPFDLWKTEALSAAAGADGDPDGDGVSTFMEFALGTDPADPITDDGHGFRRDAGGRLSLLMRRAAELAWRLESAPAPDAVEWSLVMESRGLNYQTTAPAGVSVTDVRATSQVLRITPDTASFPSRFYRLRTSRIPPQG